MAENTNHVLPQDPKRYEELIIAICPKCGSKNIAIFSDGTIACGDCDNNEDDFEGIVPEDIAW